MHAVEPIDAAYVPAKQTAQLIGPVLTWCDGAPKPTLVLAVEYFPSAHCVQVEAWASEKVPAKQSAQAVAAVTA